MTTQTKLGEIQTLCDMILSASDHVLERYQSEMSRFVSRARELAAIIQKSGAEQCGNCDGYGKGIEGLHGNEFVCPDCRGSGLVATKGGA